MQDGFYCPQCKENRLFVAENMNHTPHILASVFLCGTWLIVWLLLWATFTPIYHCNRCGHRDEERYLRSPQLREQERLYRAQQQMRSAARRQAILSSRWFWPGLTFVALVVAAILTAVAVNQINKPTAPPQALPTLPTASRKPVTASDLKYATKQFEIANQLIKQKKYKEAHYLLSQIPSESNEFSESRRLMTKIEPLIQK